MISQLDCHWYVTPIALVVAIGVIYQSSMARLSDLTSTVAVASGVPDAAARVIARSLREAGLVSKGGRGLSAARMGAADVASVLLAFASPEDVTKSGHTVKVLGDLRLEPLVPIEGKRSHDFLILEEEEDRTGLSEKQTLWSVLTTLIERYSSEGRLPPEAEVKAAKPERARLVVDSGPRESDPTPCAITLSVTKDEYGWKARVGVAERGGDDLVLNFSPSGAWPPRRRREDNPGRSHNITLPPAIAHAAIRCLRDEAPTKFQLDREDQ